MRWFLALVIGLVAVAAVASVAYGSDPNNQTGTATSTASFSQNSASSTNSNGIQLSLSLNATSLLTDQSVELSVEGYNTFPHLNNLSATDDWTVAYLSDGPCGTLNQPIGFAVLSGYYAAANASSAHPLQLFRPGFYPCPVMLAGIRAYDFFPTNSTAEVYAMCTPEPCFALDVNATTTVEGYWPQSQSGSITIQSLPQGVYTIVAGDEWGDLAFLHFSVS